ncbi:MAG: Plug domain-containing protein, partial [Myxococcales bacterium]|nr:Plug domain-containing protein [Myxococcales bacterium]
MGVLLFVSVQWVSAGVAAQDEEFGISATIRRDPDGNREARTRVSRRDMDERIPKSAPDALKYEPGVSVQQTSHGQASPFVRGLTGQQVLLLFDGVRINNGLF